MKNRQQLQNKLEEDTHKIKLVGYTISRSILILLLISMIIGFSNISLPLAYTQNSNSTESSLFHLNQTKAGDIIPGQFIITLTNETVAKESLRALADAAEQADLKVVNTFPNLVGIIVNGSENSIPALADLAEQNDTRIEIESE